MRARRQHPVVVAVTTALVILAAVAGPVQAAPTTLPPVRPEAIRHRLGARRLAERRMHSGSRARRDRRHDNATPGAEGGTLRARAWSVAASPRLAYQRTDAPGARVVGGRGSRVSLGGAWLRHGGWSARPRPPEERSPQRRPTGLRSGPPGWPPPGGLRGPHSCPAIGIGGSQGRPKRRRRKRRRRPRRRALPARIDPPRATERYTRARGAEHAQAGPASLPPGSTGRGRAVPEGWSAAHRLS